MKEAVDAGVRVAPGVRFYIQFGSIEVEEYCKSKGWIEDFRKAGVTLMRIGR